MKPPWAQPPSPTGFFQPAPAPGSNPTLRTPFLGGGQWGLTLHQALGRCNGQPQPLLCPAIGPHTLLLHPVYEVQAAMHRESGRGWGAEVGARGVGVRCWGVRDAVGSGC